jgi:Fe-S-cluster containining protein
MNIASKLTKKEESEYCLACGECCKKYWITVLPNEATNLSKTLNETRKTFLENRCMLHVKLFPKSTPGVLTYPTTFFPKRIYKLIEKHLPNVSDSFFVVPQVVLKREEKLTFSFKQVKTKQEKRNACIFIDADNACRVYDARPGPCRLFPFIAMDGFREQYPFCELYQLTSKNYAIESKIYYKKIQGYFQEVDKKGFFSVWRTPPAKGVLFLQDREIGEITIEELTQMMPKKE